MNETPIYTFAFVFVWLFAKDMKTLTWLKPQSFATLVIECILKTLVHIFIFAIGAHINTLVLLLGRLVT